LKIVLIIFLVLLAIILYKAADIFIMLRNRERIKKYWQTNAAASPPKNSIQYIVLGDSVGAGVGSSSPRKCYAGLIAASLHVRSGKPVYIVNFCVSGAKTADLIRDQLPLFGKVNAANNTVVTLEIGANNVGPDFNNEKFRQEFNQILDALPASTIVADVPYFGAGIKRDREANVEAANEIIHKAITDHKMTLAKIFDQTKNYGSLRDYAADFFHPNDRGHKNWSKAFIAALK
jgi:acyl-CoA thioesterase-1